MGGGTGITPMYQIAAHSAATSTDRLEMSLLFANRTPLDVMLQPELDKLATECSRFHVTYSVDKATIDSSSSESGSEAAKPWPGETGLVSAKMLEDALGKLRKRPELVCICGPPGFHKTVKSLLTEELGYKSDEVFEF